VDVSKLIERARDAAKRHDLDGAVELYLQAMKLAPANIDCRREIRLIEDRLSKEKSPGLVSHIRAFLDYLFIRILFALKKYESAMDKAETALSKHYMNFGIMMLLGRSAKALGLQYVAITVFEDTLGAGHTDQQRMQASRELARAYGDACAYELASNTWKKIQKYMPDDREADVQIRDLAARVLTETIGNKTARTQQTAQQQKQTARTDRENAEIKTEEDLRAAIGDAKEDIDTCKDERQLPRLHAKLGDLYKRGERYDDAKAAYQAAVAADPNNYTWRFLLHDLEIAQRSKVLKAKRAANASDANLEELALLEFQRKSYLEREKQYSTDNKIKFTLGCVCFDLAVKKGDNPGLYEQAIIRFQATFRDPKYKVESGLRLGAGFVAKRQFDLALRKFDETLAGMPEIKNEQWKNLMYARADCLLKMGEAAEAKRGFLAIYEVDVIFKDVGKKIEAL
jgi:tetratricopeptide (TPR) repeat protein